ncbi:MAG: stage II sporulation protein D [Oscillospiraceae bacterium]
MKKEICVILIFAVILLSLPCIVLTTAGSNKIQDIDTVKILFEESGKVESVKTESYIIGAVMAQMPADFNDNALKAQAVLAHTYILHRRISETDKPTDGLKGADISDDSTLYQKYFTEKQAKKYYGDDYTSAYKKVKKAVRSVKNQILTYNSKPIIVAFHAISCGKTESAEDMWNEKIPYLISAESSSDIKVKDFKKTLTLSAEEVTKRLKTAFSECNSAERITIEKMTDNGTVTLMSIGNQQVSGTDFADALGLASPCFTFESDNNEYKFTTKGCGHLVGMSQYGANSMAKNNKSCEEILEHYFPHTKLESI